MELRAIPRISIVTISFNQHSYLPRCVESIAAQSYSDFEHIIVDPGSSDGSREYLASLDDSRVTLVFEPDTGPAQGLNHGVQKVRGEIFMYLNADDELAPGALELVAERHDRDPEADAIIGNGWLVDEETEPLAYVRTNRLSPRRAALNTQVILQQSVSYRASLFQEGLRFNEANRIDWDAELLFTLARSGSAISYVRDSVGYFRLQNESITMRKDVRRAVRRSNRQLARDFSGPWRWLGALEVPARAVKKFTNVVLGLVDPPQFPGLSRL